MQYAVIVHRAEEGGYWSEVPALPGCVSQGKTLDATVTSTRAAIEQWLTYLRDKGEGLPPAEDIVLTVEVAA